MFNTVSVLTEALMITVGVLAIKAQSWITVNMKKRSLRGVKTMSLEYKYKKRKALSLSHSQHT